MFGNAKLYRQDRSGYRLAIFAGPRALENDYFSSLYHIGTDDGKDICLGNQDGVWAIYQYHRKSLRRIYRTFDEWVTNACRRARKAYSVSEWRQILGGPAPFSDEELAVVENRRLFEWKVIGIHESGDQIITVKNGGDSIPPALTIGVRSKDGNLNGAVRIYVGHVLPGQVAELRDPCYNKLVGPEQIELFALPDPQPEDPKYYAEFWGLDGRG